MVVEDSDKTYRQTYWIVHKSWSHLVSCVIDMLQRCQRKHENDIASIYILIKLRVIQKQFVWKAKSS